MPDCELCGKPAKTKSKVEGVLLNTCERCTSFGQVVDTRPPPAKLPAKLPSELDYILVSGFSKIIKSARERSGLSREQLAGKIKERVSFVERAENGWEPPLDFIKKLERFLKVNLLEKAERSKGGKMGGIGKLTVGDVVEVKV